MIGNEDIAIPPVSARGKIRADVPKNATPDKTSCKEHHAAML
jgi:hypothetical protein